MTQKKHLYFLFVLVLFSCSKKDDTPAKSSAKSITSFAFSSLNPVVNAYVDSVQREIRVTLPIGTDASKLVPTITISSKATILPASGVVQDFTKPVTYTVTAEDGTTQSYPVKVLVLKSSAKSIKSFSFNTLTPAVTATIDSVKNTITATLPTGTDLTKLVPTISISDRATISPASGVAQDFSKPITYTVTAEDGSIIVYIANITVASTSVTPIGLLTNDSQKSWLLKSIVVGGKDVTSDCLKDDVLTFYKTNSTVLHDDGKISCGGVQTESLAFTLSDAKVLTIVANNINETYSIIQLTDKVFIYQGSAINESPIITLTAQ